MAKNKLQIAFGVILITLLFTASAYPLVQIPLLQGTVYSTETNQPVRSGHVEIIDFNQTPPVVLYVAQIHSTGSYGLADLFFPNELDGIRIMAYPSDLSWDKPELDGFSTPSIENNHIPPGAVNLSDAQLINNAYVLDIFVDWLETAKTFSLEQNYPNPFNPKTSISFGIPVGANVTLKVYNMNGQEVATLYNNEFLSEGIRRVEFDGSNLSSGVYFYSITTSEFSDIKKMILIK
jgi:hypothetical protein